MPKRHLDNHAPDPPGVYSLVGLPPNEATLALRAGFDHEVIVEIRNGIADVTSVGYLSPTAARLLAIEIERKDRGPAERDAFGDDLRLDGWMVVIRRDGKDRDRVLLERPDDREQFSAALEFLAHQAEVGE